MSLAPGGLGWSTTEPEEGEVVDEGSEDRRRPLLGSTERLSVTRAPPVSRSRSNS
eukprot:SAG25_NODE_3366_length_1110_cov_5.704253_1_plen_54_part_10